MHAVHSMHTGGFIAATRFLCSHLPCVLYSVVCAMGLKFMLHILQTTKLDHEQCSLPFSYIEKLMHGII